MLIEVLIEIYERDIANLRAEVEAYQAEEDLWLVTGEITNSAGNLCLHICGNLQHFIGATLGQTGYVRNRDLEFSADGVSRAEVLAGINAAHRSVIDTLSKIDESTLSENYPIQVFGHPMTTGFFLVHLATHLDYHLGQINYHRRILAAN